jgi:aminoglycoside phosphotransferase (APT) family kinase protein
MTPPWAADITVSEELARSHIEAQFPQFAPVTIRLFGAGWDNTAFLVNDAYVFRFPRRDLAQQFLDAEIRLLPALASRLPVAVPLAKFVGYGTAYCPWKFVGYELLPGRTACAANLNDTQRTALAEPLGRCLAILHGIPASEAKRLGAEPDTLGRLDLARRVPWARERLEQAQNRNIIADARPFAAILDAAPPAYQPRANTLVHGDLYARHLLVDSENRLTGVIDWGDVHLGDPAVDLAIAHSFLPPSAHGRFQTAYGAISSLTWQMARLRALWHTLATAVYACEAGDAELDRACRVALRYLAAATQTA